MHRRSFLRLVPAAGLVAVSLPTLAACSDDTTASDATGDTPGGGPGTTGGTAPPAPAAAFAGYGPLLAPDANGLRLPEGFTSRIVAESGVEVAGTGYVWPPNPDGGAVFAVDDGWIYVANSESGPPDGGASMLRFDADGEVVEARRILGDTVRNCAGGAMPWQTWLSCEEVPTGLVYECDPTGASPAEVRPAMGVFNHEAAAADPGLEVIYLTEDDPTGGLYRFRPDTWGDLSAGTLEVLADVDGALRWLAVPDPAGVSSPAAVATKDQVEGIRRFDGGEGADVIDGALYFSTKGDNRLWRLDPVGDDGAEVTVVWDSATADDGVVIEDVDNVVVGPGGLPFVAEDGDAQHLVVVGPDGDMWPVAQSVETPDSEIAGPAFSPDGTRVYFSSQRSPGRTFEVTGPFTTA